MTRNESKALVSDLRAYKPNQHVFTYDTINAADHIEELEAMLTRALDLLRKCDALDDEVAEACSCDYPSSVNHKRAALYNRVAALLKHGEAK